MLRASVKYISFLEYGFIQPGGCGVVVLLLNSADMDSPV